MIKKIAFFFSIFLFFNCSSNDNDANCIRPISINFTSDLNNPQFVNALVPGGFANVSGGFKGILLLNVSGNDFVAYDRICPANDCDSPMVFEGGIFLKCQCDNSKYGVGKGIGGAPQTDGFNCPAIEYKVTTAGTSIRISNF